MTEDWKFQVLHKNQLKSVAQQEENNRVREERAESLQSRNQQKQSDFVKLQDSIKDRIQQENYSEYLRRQEKIRLENKHSEENKESYKIKREIEQEKNEREQEKKESSENLKLELLRQIGQNKVRKQKLLEEKKNLESFERNRLDHLIQAEDIQRKYETKMTNNETCEFNMSTRNFRKIQTQLERENNFAFLDEGWRQEKEKIQEKLNLNQTRRETDRICALGKSSFNLTRQKPE